MRPESAQWLLERLEGTAIAIRDRNFKKKRRPIIANVYEEFSGSNYCPYWRDARPVSDQVAADSEWPRRISELGPMWRASSIYYAIYPHLTCPMHSFSQRSDGSKHISHRFDHHTLQPLSCCWFQHPSLWSDRTSTTCILYSTVLRTNIIAKDVPICSIVGFCWFKLGDSHWLCIVVWSSLPVISFILSAICSFDLASGTSVLLLPSCSTIVSCRLLQQPAISHLTRMLPVFSEPPRRTVISTVSDSSNLMTPTSSHVCSLTSRIYCMTIQSMTRFWADIAHLAGIAALRSRYHSGQGGTIPMFWFCRQLHWILLGRVDMDVRQLHLTNLASHWSILKDSDGGCQKSFSFWIAMLSVHWYCASRAIYTHNRLTSSNDRLYSIRKYWLHCTSRYQDLWQSF
jgi:hypothetical protein